MTHQREIILQELQASRQHLTADELYERVRKRLPRISLATVYRNLEILTQAGIIAKREVSGRQKRFDSDVSEHDHIFCIQCHRLDNLELNRDEVGGLPAGLVEGYTITGYRLEFSGICRECRLKNEKMSKETETWDADAHAVRRH
ncbi:MAG: transcriptional repressor [Desulfocapsaceae bacterium]|nr:transcriptional repressor [Desulfocapsaceae bacterium]